MENLNVFLGPNGWFDYLNPSRHSPASLVELPSLFLRSVSSLNPDEVRIVVKMMNERPFGLKVVPVFAFYDDLLEKGRIIPGRTVTVIPSSGGAARAFAVIGQMLGCKVKVFVPMDAPLSKRVVIENTGAEIILTREVPGESGRDRARELAGREDHIVFDQYDSDLNEQSHAENTIDEILRQMWGEEVDLCGIAAGAGTGGTSNAAFAVLEKEMPDAVALAIVCEEENPLSGMRSLSHLTREYVPLANKYPIIRWKVERPPSYKTCINLAAVGVNAGLTGGGTVWGTISWLEHVRDYDPELWGRLHNPAGQIVFAAIIADPLELYLDKLSTVLDSDQMRPSLAFPK